MKCVNIKGPKGFKKRIKKMEEGMLKEKKYI